SSSTTRIFFFMVGVPQFVDTYDTDDERLSDTWLLGQQYALDGKIITAGNNVTPFILKNSLPDGLYIGELEGARINKFAVKEKAMSNLDNDFPLFRYAHILMMKAECLLRTNKADDAAAIVSQVRARAFKNTPTKATVTGAQLMGPSKYNYGYVENYKIVDPGNTATIQYGGFLDELGWEFGWEAHRRIDNIRFGVFTTKSWLSHKPQGDYRIVFPIPQPAMNANTLLSQNPAYAGK
ncbi:MAG: RagB/SusD family nutrient uptake outer membrane protein, partial [Bacteroidota bacterium]